MGIGANAAVFTVVERVLLRPLPVSKPHELVYITDERILTQSSPRFSYPFYAVLRATNVLDGVAARLALGLNASVNGQTVRVSGELVSGNYFSVFGASMVTGRPLSPEDDRTPGAHPVAVISEPFWRRMFASDPAVAGRSVTLNDQAFTILGVAANGFTGPILERARGHMDPVGHAAGVRPEPVDRCPHELARTRRSIAPGTEPGAGGRSAQRPVSAACVRAAVSRVGEVAGPAAGQLACARRAGIRTHRALCAERAGPGAGLRQCGLPGRGAVGRPPEGNRDTPGPWRPPVTPAAATAHRRPRAGGDRRHRGAH